MNKKHTVKKTAALILGLSFALSGAACGFITTDADADMEQIVAEVNIASYLEKDELYGSYATALSEIIDKGGVSTDIPKRDLISYFLSVGYTYVNSYGYTYKQTFEMLMDMLVSRKIVVQYAMAYYLHGGLKADECMAYVKSEQDKYAEGSREKALLKAHPEVSVLKYFLTENGADEAAYTQAIYAHKQAINSSIDSMEESIIEAEEETHDHGEVRTTPTNANVEKTDYVPELYEIYTGRNSASDCGEYEELDGSTTTTRKQAYNSFLANLQANNLIQKGEDTSDFTKIDYYYVELAAQLEQALITKYTEDLNEASYARLTPAYVHRKYGEMLATQTDEYGKDYSAFETAVGSLSDTAFALYAPQENFGMVYNILIPFSATQEKAYNSAKNKGLSEQELFKYRETLLTEVQYKDLRDSWFCEHEDENYAYEKDGKWYFFENNLTNADKYESLGQYAGGYAYQGKVEKATMEATSEYLGNIDDFIEEFNGYVGGAGANLTSTYGVYEDADGETNYEGFMYYKGSVDVGTVSLDNYFVKGTASYEAVSKVNELMFAYSTDPGCLNTYLGYAVSPDKTSYVPEFEYAAQEAVKDGAGTYVVCATDYGWHLLYVSYVFPKGEVFAVADETYWNDMAKEESEGTFANLFYEYLKSKISDDTTLVQNGIILEYNNDTCVKLHKSKYEDLLEIDS
ncbi:MAG: hypothetical protein IJ506_05750 [Clostridia bacterium]|nr:hypothetical protein [Clostridia bacterium]